MRTILFVLLIAASLFAEEKQPRLDYMVEYTTNEPCRDCTFRNAVVCFSENPDCGVPRFDYRHYELFETAKAAIKFANDGCRDLSDASGGVIVISSVRADYPRKFVRLLKVQEIPVEATKITQEIPQPTTKVETTTYRLK